MQKMLVVIFFLCAFHSSMVLGQKAAQSSEKLDIRLSTNGNNIAFDKSEITAPFGKELKIRFINEANKGSEILHNVVILKEGSFDEFVKDLQKHGYDLNKMQQHPAVLKMSRVLSPGDEDFISFQPSKPGLYPYLCIMPGHADMLGMKGILHIKK